MTERSLNEFVEAVRVDWGPISTTLVSRCKEYLARLAMTSPTEEWLASLLSERPATRQLHREFGGFMLLAHAENQGLYRPPHDHGRAWVVYAVQSGELEVGTYAKVSDGRGTLLVRRETHTIRRGEARAYLPGDIHDTLCVSEDALVLRFTERDLRHEDQVERRLTRFIEQGGEWLAPAA